MSQAKTKTKRKPAGKAASKRGGKRASTSAPKSRQSPKRASRAVAKAKAAGAEGPHGTDAQRSLRDAAIIARLETGAPQRDVAKEFGIAERTVREVRDKRAARPSPLDDTPMEILEGLAKDYLASVADFKAMAFRHGDANPAVALGAMKGALVANERYLELMSLVGKLPENLELFRAEGVLRRVADELIAAMGRVERGEMSAAEAADFFRSLVEGEERKQLGVGDG